MRRNGCIEGIGPSDCKKIRQLIIEVHDINNRLNEITSLLTQQGYTVKTDQENWSLHKLMFIYTVYAIRVEGSVAQSYRKLKRRTG